MDLKTYNLLCGAGNKPPMNCLINEDYFMEKIGGSSESSATFYFKDTLKNKEGWGLLMEWLKKYFDEPKLERILVKAIKAKKNDDGIVQILLEHFKPFDLFSWQLARKKKILEFIKSQIDIRGLRIVIYCDEVFTELFKKIGLDVWHPDLEKNVYDICIYDDEIEKIPATKKIGMRNFLKEKYYYYVCSPDISRESQRSVQNLKYRIEIFVFGFLPNTNQFYLNSTEFLKNRFCGKLTDVNVKISHLCKLLCEQKKNDLYDIEYFFKCKPNPNYIEY